MTRVVSGAGRARVRQREGGLPGAELRKLRAVLELDDGWGGARAEDSGHFAEGVGEPRQQFRLKTGAPPSAAALLLSPPLARLQPCRGLPCPGI